MLNNHAELMDIDPSFFPGHEDPKKSCMYFGFEIGDGWVPLVKELLLLAKHNKHHPWPKDDTSFDTFTVDQVKEKYGGLCFYYSGGNKQFDGAAQFAEQLSLHTCMTCGLPGTLRSTHGWLGTFCNTHAPEGNKEIPDETNN